MAEPLRHEDFEIERVYPRCRDHVWAAWAITEMKRNWSGDGLTVMDFRVGGIERGAFTNDMGEHRKEATFFEISERSRIVYAYSMAVNGRVHSVSLATVLFADEGGGTRLTYRERIYVIPPSDGVKGRRHGWGVLLDGLAAFLASDTGAAADRNRV